MLLGNSNFKEYKNRQMQPDVDEIVFITLGSVHYFEPFSKSEQCSDFGGWVGNGTSAVRISGWKKVVRHENVIFEQCTIMIFEYHEWLYAIILKGILYILSHINA